MVTHFHPENRQPDRYTRPVIDNGQINGRKELSLLPDKKLTDFLGHEIEVSIRIAFQRQKI